MSSLITDFGRVNYESSEKNIFGQNVRVITFTPSRVTLLMPYDEAPKLGTGNAHLKQYRKFLPNLGKYVHWLSFGFIEPNGSQERKIKAQILLKGRLQVGLSMTKKGASAAFVDIQCRSIRRRKITNSKVIN